MSHTGSRNRAHRHFPEQVPFTPIGMMLLGRTMDLNFRACGHYLQRDLNCRCCSELLPCGTGSRCFNVTAISCLPGDISGDALAFRLTNTFSGSAPLAMLRWPIPDICT